MYDTAQNNQFPPGAAAYAAYVDGGIGDQPNYAYIVNTFPKAHHLSIALFPSDNADALDVEPGAASPGDIPGWFKRQQQRGIARPVIYASASLMNDSILQVLSQAGIPRSSARLWSAHYGAGQHICGPTSCGLLSVEADGTQWTSNALGLVLDESLLLDNFFPSDPKSAEAELQSGPVTNGSNALTVIAVAPGTAHHVAFATDNTNQGLPPARLRVAIFDTTWHVTHDVIVDGTKGATVLTFGNPSKTSAIAIRRSDAGNAVMGYVVY
jgi:hypothetical protein